MATKAQRSDAAIDLTAAESPKEPLKEVLYEAAEDDIGDIRGSYFEGLF